MQNTKTTKADAAAATRNLFHGRYINIAAITEDARTISTQCWCSSMEDIYKAEAVMNSWLLPDAEKWNGKVVFAAMHDSYQKTSRNFKRIVTNLTGCAMLKEVL
jgi:hypothetical protein